MDGLETKESGKSDAELLREAKANYKLADDHWRKNFDAWREDAKFRIVGRGNQWPDAIKKARESKKLPCLEVDKVNQFVKQVVNDGRQNRPSIKVLPVDDRGDEDAANAFQGVIRSIWNRSRGDEAIDTALDHAVGNGFGFFRILTDYEHENSFRQEIVIRRVRNPLTIRLGPFQAADGSDAPFAFVEEDIQKDEFKRKYPKAKATNWRAEGYSDGWSSDTTVKVCEYWYKVYEPVLMHQLDDSTVVSDEEYQMLLEERGPENTPAIAVDSMGQSMSREITQCKVKWVRMTGAEVLERRDWQGKYIPIIPVFGDESDIDGEVIYTGLVRPAKDPQRLYNFSRSAFAQRVAMSPKAPWLAAKEAVEGQPGWKTQNVGDQAVLFWNARDEKGDALPQPSRIDPADVPAGFMQDMELAEHDIQAAIGMYNASLGERSNEKSGRAIMARQREGDTATFHFQDNLNRAIGFAGRILVDLVPKVLDSKRVARILGEDGSSEPVEIDPEMEMPKAEVGGKTIYNFGAADWDVVISAGPSYTTKRQEAAEAMLAMAERNPSMWTTHGDLIVKTQDWPGAEDFAERSMLVMPPPLRQAIEGGKEQQLPPQVQSAIQAVEQQQQMVEQAHQQLQQMAQEVQADKAAAEAEKAKLEAARKELDALAKILQSKYEELSAKLELQAMKVAVPVPQEMPPGKEEPAIAPDQSQPPSGGFFTPGEM